MRLSQLQGTTAARQARLDICGRQARLLHQPGSAAASRSPEPQRLIDSGHCSCDRCGGHLEAGACTSCGCMHPVQEATRFHARTAAWIPNHLAGVCRDADTARERQHREHEELERQRRGTLAPDD